MLQGGMPPALFEMPLSIECKFIIMLPCFLFILAPVGGLRLTLSGENGVRVQWRRIDNLPSEFGAVYLYIIYYYEDVPSADYEALEQDKSLSIPIGSSSTTIEYLNEGSEYQFEIAVSKQVGMEERLGDRSAPERIRIDASMIEMEETTESTGNIIITLLRCKHGKEGNAVRRVMPVSKSQ